MPFPLSFFNISRISSRFEFLVPEIEERKSIFCVLLEILLKLVALLHFSEYSTREEKSLSKLSLYRYLDCKNNKTKKSLFAPKVRKIYTYAESNDLIDIKQITDMIIIKHPDLHRLSRLHF